MGKNKKIAILGTATFTLAIGAWFSYQEFFTKGLDNLSSRVCDEGVERDTVRRVLPDTRSAEEGADTNGSGDSFMFSCRVYTANDSILSGEAKIQDSSQKTWEKYYKSYGGESKGETEQSSSDGIYALSKEDFASVYVPCVPNGSRPDDASQEYALVTEVRVIGESRITGIDLHQALTDFAYQITRRAYSLGDCQGVQEFPEKLPRFEKS
ncbi:hypothetical protein [Streptomyces sp. NPDC017202]|uniref:hypothetical protein n=1 Tax=Streptomyces sp. NPDC017202 TaxID=3364981 RepID=UPI00379A7641